MAKAQTCPYTVADEDLDAVQGAGQTMFLAEGKPLRAKTQMATLLFDEADALLGKRTDVTDNHDRYANLETSF